MPDFGLLQNPNFASAALGGYQAGQALGRQRRLDAALGGVDLSRPETIMPVLQADPQTGSILYQAAAGARKQQNAARVSEIAPQAVAGDKAAISELWGLDSDLASKLTDDHIKHVDAGVKAAGNAAFGLLRLPPEQRAAAWDAAIDTLDEQYPGLAPYKGQYSETNLWSVLSQAGMSKDAADFLAPKYQAVVPGGTLGQTNPYAGAVYAGGQQAPQTESTHPAGLVSPGTIDLDRRRVLHNRDGSISTERSFSIGTDEGEVLIPQVVNGRLVSQEQAIEHYRQTGEHLGIFKSAADADAYARTLHERQGARYGNVAQDAASIAQRLYPGIQITDNVRDPNSALGKANPGSWHVRSKGAIDARPISGMSFDQYVQGFRDAGYPIIEARDEVKNPSAHATGPHWHVVLGERDQRAGLNAPRVGAERTGAGGVKYRFKGGNPADKSSWERADG